VTSLGPFWSASSPHTEDRFIPALRFRPFSYHSQPLSDIGVYLNPMPDQVRAAVPFAGTIDSNILQVPTLIPLQCRRVHRAQADPPGFVKCRTSTKTAAPDVGRFVAGGFGES
jgi:hypothetical protein